MPMFTSAPPQRTRRHARVVVLGAIVAAVVIAIGVAVTVGGSTAGPTYRTAVVGRRSVAQVLDGVGTFEPTSQASVAFPVAGTVSDVRVAVGDVVAVGDPLASLDATSLQRSLHTAQASTATASLNLQRALAGETSGSGGSGSGSGRATTGSSSAAIAPVSFSIATGDVPAGHSPSDPQTSTGSGDELATAQRAVLAAQRTVDARLDAAELRARGGATGVRDVPGWFDPTQLDLDDVDHIPALGTAQWLGRRRPELRASARGRAARTTGRGPSAAGAEHGGEPPRRAARPACGDLWWPSSDGRDDRRRPLDALVRQLAVVRDGPDQHHDRGGRRRLPR